MSGDPVLKVEGLWKRYGLAWPAPVERLRERRGWNTRDKWALRDVSFALHPGEVLGIVGRNGAGKSTLLKTLAGVSPPTFGRVTVRGRLFPMIELNAGVNLELTGRENVWLLANMLGMPSAWLRQRMEAIEDFCELKEWFEQPAWKYSSGMLARLGFAVAMHVEADLLLIDEVLAVGDISFQRKCFAEMDRLRRKGTAALFVSHSLRQVERLCERALFLRDGRVEAEGEAGEVVHKYHFSSLTSAQLAHTGSVYPARFDPADHVRVTAVEFQSPAGEPMVAPVTGQPLDLVLHIESDEEFRNVIAGVNYFNDQLVYIAGASNQGSGVAIHLPAGPSRLRIRHPLFTPLLGVHSLAFKFIHETGAVLGAANPACYFDVHTPPAIRECYHHGMVMMETVWQPST